MTNSMDFTEVYDDPKSGIMTYVAVLGWKPKLPDVEYPDSLYDYLVTLKTDKAHKDGEIFHYQTPKTDVVNWVTNRVNNESFQEALYNEVWSKIGTEGETYVLLDNNATLVAGGGLNATPYNLARFAIMMLNDGKFNGDPAKIEVPTMLVGGWFDLHDMPRVFTDYVARANSKAQEHHRVIVGPWTHGGTTRDVYRLATATARGEIRPVSALHDCRMVGMYRTPMPPMRGFVDRLLRRLRELNVSRPGIHDIGEICRAHTDDSEKPDGNSR